MLTSEKPLSSIFWFWIPVIAMTIQAILEVTVSKEILSGLHSENGPHELLEFFILVGGLIVCLKYFLTSEYKSRLMNFWFGLAFICCFYVAGEEISWGQHVWDWATPDYWNGVNDQGETNLHNTSSWFDQKPRLILLLGITVGTLILPHLYERRKLPLPCSLGILLPSKKLTVIALLVVIPQLIEKLFEAFNVSIFVRFSEVQELYMFYFVFLYLILLQIELRKQKNT